MIVTLTIQDKIIAGRIVSDKNVSIPGYLQGLKQAMIEEFEDIINDEIPVFFCQDLRYEFAEN